MMELLSYYDAIVKALLPEC